MTPEEFNIKCAEFMGWNVHPDANEGAAMVADLDAHGHIDFFPFMPYSDANDRNKVIEKMRMHTDCKFNRINDQWEWTCVGDLNLSTMSKDKSMEAAQIKCISKVLEDR